MQLDNGVVLHITQLASTPWCADAAGYDAGRQVTAMLATGAPRASRENEATCSHTHPPVPSCLQLALPDDLLGVFFEVNWLHGLDQATTNLL
jgi:hypothetical protein